jgi:hypothetical protein
MAYHDTFPGRRRKGRDRDPYLYDLRALDDGLRAQAQIGLQADFKITETFLYRPPPQMVMRLLLGDGQRDEVFICLYEPGEQHSITCSCYDYMTKRAPCRHIYCAIDTLLDFDNKDHNEIGAVPLLPKDSELPIEIGPYRRLFEESGLEELADQERLPRPHPNYAVYDVDKFPEDEQLCDMLSTWSDRTPLEFQHHYYDLNILNNIEDPGDSDIAVANVYRHADSHDDMFFNMRRILGREFCDKKCLLKLKESVRRMKAKIETVDIDDEIKIEECGLGFHDITKQIGYELQRRSSLPSSILIEMIGMVIRIIEIMIKYSVLYQSLVQIPIKSEDSIIHLLKFYVTYAVDSQDLLNDTIIPALKAIEQDHQSEFTYELTQLYKSLDGKESFIFSSDYH